MLLEREAELSTYWHGQSYGEALHQIRIGRQDLVIVGLRIEGISIFDLIKDMRNVNPRAQVLVYGSCHGGAYIKRFLRLGARAFVRKSESIEVLLAAIRSVLKGKISISSDNNREQEQETFGKNSGGLDTPLLALAIRELEVFQLIGAGKTSPEIAKGMALSVKTVETYRANIIEKLSLRNNIELIQTAFSWVQEKPCFIEHLTVRSSPNSCMISKMGASSKHEQGQSRRAVSASRIAAQGHNTG